MLNSEEKLALALSLIRNLYQIAVSVMDTPASIEEFCTRYRLHTVQGLFDSERLSSFIENAEGDKIHHITGVLQTNVILVKVEELPLIIGPFCPLIMTADDCNQLLNGLSIQNVSAEELLAYRDRFPVLGVSSAVNIVRALLKTLYQGSLLPADFEVVEYSAEEAEAEEEEIFTDYNSMIEEHYVTERRFMEAVAKGEKAEAIELLKVQQRAFQSFKRLGTTLENERIGSAIVRTMLRCAVMNAGMPALENDVLSRRNTVATRRAEKVEDILKAKEQMVAEYADAMKLHRLSGNSNVTFKVMSYMERNYQHSFTIESLAEELGYTPNYLITLFRRETGMTPDVYLRKVRTKIAASLLSETPLEIAEVADKVGISDANYFVKLFRRDYGMTPSEYRRRNRL